MVLVMQAFIKTNIIFSGIKTYTKIENYLYFGEHHLEMQSSEGWIIWFYRFWGIVLGIDSVCQKLRLPSGLGGGHSPHVALTLALEPRG